MENEKPSSLPSALERLRNKYRLVIMNDDTYEQVITFRLSRLSVYVAMSTIFLLMVVFTTALIMFTPLKYYIPGYGSQESRSALQVLKIRTDSLEHSIRQKDMYLENVKKVLNGDATTIIDTTLLPVEPVEYSDDF